MRDETIDATESKAPAHLESRCFTDTTKNQTLRRIKSYDILGRLHGILTSAYQTRRHVGTAATTPQMTPEDDPEYVYPVQRVPES